MKEGGEIENTKVRERGGEIDGKRERERERERGRNFTIHCYKMAL